MAKLQTKQEFIDYCLRKLGHPVIKINVAQEQLADRVDEAFEVYSEKHFDATEEQWVHYQVTQDDVDAGYIIVPSDILAVISVMPANTLTATASSDMFSYQYQIMVNELSPWSPFDSIDYFMKMTSIEETRWLIDVNERFKHVRHESKLTIYKKLSVGENLILRVFRILDQEKVWNDRWLKQYATALIKLQWAENTGKFTGVQLLGGVEINSDRMLAEAKEEIQKLEQQLNEEFSEPIGFIFG